MKARELGRSGLVSASDGMNGRFWRRAVVRGLGIPLFTNYPNEQEIS
jgi:hypothetical protein